MRNSSLKIYILICVISWLSACSSSKNQETLRLATFNVSIEATNYLSRNDIAEDPTRSAIVGRLLTNGDHPQIRNIAEIIQRTRPDVLLLNEFDYIKDPEQGIELFIKNYLNVSQNSQPKIDYPYYYIAPVNTGVPSPFDLDNNGTKTGVAGDAYGFGYYPGQYAMALLSRYPIKLNEIRTLKSFLWKDMPDALKPYNRDDSPWYSNEEWNKLRLSSKSHWDIPIEFKKGRLHIIAAHPTPPTFDGDEDRNGKRNHDEIRLINDYISDKSYLKDDNGTVGGLNKDSRFVVMGDLNSSPDEGDSIKTAIRQLTDHPLVDSSCVPRSSAGQLARPDNQFASEHTAAWGLRVDYVLPSRLGLKTTNCGIFWPDKNDPQYTLIETRKASSDHRLVWVDIALD